MRIIHTSDDSGKMEDITITKENDPAEDFCVKGQKVISDKEYDVKFPVDFPMGTFRKI